jgi:hypothetical protein
MRKQQKIFFGKKDNFSQLLNDFWHFLLQVSQNDVILFIFYFCLTKTSQPITHFGKHFGNQSSTTQGKGIVCTSNKKQHFPSFQSKNKGF